MNRAGTLPVRLLTALLAALLLSAPLPGCSAEHADGRFRIVATTFSAYDWTREILGERASAFDLLLIPDNGVDLHSFQPSAGDLILVMDCDLLLCIGGSSDAWATGALKNAAAENRTVETVVFLDVLGSRAKEEELVEGMEPEEEEDDGVEYDEHVWLSLRNASLLCGAIEEALCRIDPDNGSLYRENAAAYRAKLAALDESFRAAVEEAGGGTLLFADRFPFRYLTDDYGLAYYAAFAGCSAETEASVRTVDFLVRKVDELGLKTILRLEESDGALARTVRDNSASKDQQILAIHSLQSVGKAEIAEGATYLTLMEADLAVLKEALKS